MAERCGPRSCRRDILQIAEYLEEEGGAELARRFIDATQDTFETLAAMPKAGVTCGFKRSALKRVPRWPVSDSEHWLVFYTPKSDGVEIIYVIHGARDIVNLLDG